MALEVKNPRTNAGDARDAGLIRGSGRSPGVGTGNLLQCSCLGNPMDRGAWRATVHEVTTSLAQLSTHTQPCLALPASHPPVCLEPLARKVLSRRKRTPTGSGHGGRPPAPGPAGPVLSCLLPRVLWDPSTWATRRQLSGQTPYQLSPAR